MKAEEKELSFIQNSSLLEVPFFQRGYVWNEENWAELLDNLLDENQSHFIGSIILKSQPGDASEPFERTLIIDGQQRLTTLSILLRACFDSFASSSENKDWIAQQHSYMTKSLLCQDAEYADKVCTKILHSRLDADDYDAVIRGAWTKRYHQIMESRDEEGKREFTSKILDCYYYFRRELSRRPPEEKYMLWDILIGTEAKILVKIDLESEENEQAIFDTVNRTGVRLRSSDTIKNALFQRALEWAENDKAQKQSIIDFYIDSWEKTFLRDAEDLEFWQSVRPVGRLSRDNFEILLSCVALIKGFYSPLEHRLSDLPVLYKNHVKDSRVEDIEILVDEICSYATTYRKNFELFSGSTRYPFRDRRGRLDYNLVSSEMSTFDPFILKTLHENINQARNKVTKDVLELFAQLESYVTRHIICGVSTKGFNKECLSLVHDKKTIADLMRDKDSELNNSAIEASANRMRRTLEGYELNPDLHVAVVNPQEIAAVKLK